MAEETKIEDAIRQNAAGPKSAEVDGHVMEECIQRTLFTISSEKFFTEQGFLLREKELDHEFMTSVTHLQFIRFSNGCTMDMTYLQHCLVFQHILVIAD